MLHVSWHRASKAVGKPSDLRASLATNIELTYRYHVPVSTPWLTVVLISELRRSHLDSEYRIEVSISPAPDAFNFTSNTTGTVRPFLSVEQGFGNLS